MKDLSYQTTFERTFLLEKIPEPLSRASEHLQIFDNYIEKTRLCLRKIRTPKTKEYSFILEQKFPANESDLSAYKISTICLNEAEYKVLDQLERHKTNELRYNRYFYDFQGKDLEIDVYLSKEIRGLIIGRIFYDSAEEIKKNELPEFAILEVTQNNFFVGQNLIGKTLADIQSRFKK